MALNSIKTFRSNFILFTQQKSEKGDITRQYSFLKILPFSLRHVVVN